MFRRDRLSRLRERLTRAREQLEVAAAQALALREEADDLNIRALSSERADDKAEAVAAERHARAAEEACDRLRAEVADVTRQIDEELDRRLGGT